MLPSSLACERLTIVLEYPFFANLRVDEEKAYPFTRPHLELAYQRVAKAWLITKGKKAPVDAFRALQSASRTRPSNNAQVLIRVGV